MVPLDVLLSKLGYGTFSSVANHALADQVSKAGIATLCQINSISDSRDSLHALFLYGGKASPSSHTSGAATAGCSSSLQRLAGGEAAFSVSLSSCCSAFGSAGSEAGGLAESSTGVRLAETESSPASRLPGPNRLGTEVLGAAASQQASKEPSLQRSSPQLQLWRGAGRLLCRL